MLHSCHTWDILKLKIIYLSFQINGGLIVNKTASQIASRGRATERDHHEELERRTKAEGLDLGHPEGKKKLMKC